MAKQGFKIAFRYRCISDAQHTAFLITSLMVMVFTVVTTMYVGLTIRRLDPTVQNCNQIHQILMNS